MNRIKDLRKQKGINQSELAAYLNVQQNTISKYENSILELDYASLQKLSVFFDCSIDYLLGNADFNANDFVVQMNKDSPIIDLGDLPEEEQRKVIDYYNYIVAKHHNNKEGM